MPRRVLLQRDGQTFDLVEVPAPNEHHLQEVMKSQPQLIPADDLGFDDDLLVIGRETALASGYIDLLCLARSGDVVLIEFKTGPQNPDFRHALAQVLDYGSDLWGLSVEDFDRGVVQRFLQSGRAEAAMVTATDLKGLLAASSWDLTAEEADALRDRLGDVLLTGDFHYVIAAQRFTEAMKNTLDYLNATMRHGRFFLVEIVQLEGREVRAHAAQVVSSPLKRAAGGANGPSPRADEGAFLSSITDGVQREAMRDLLASFKTLGLETKWRSKGASIRITTPDRRQPLSIAWILPDEGSWQGARHATFGVDPASLSQTPSVEAAVLRYTSAIAGIRGGRPTPSKLDAFIFEGSELREAQTEIVDALSQLVEALNESV